jgi:hypothetical protein
MSSILLLQKDRFHPDLVSTFGRDLLNAIVNEMHKKLKLSWLCENEACSQYFKVSGV